MRVEGEFLLFFRRAGTVSEKHFHHGLCSHKNPEIIFLLQGKMEICYQGLTTNEDQTLLAKPPSKVEIYPQTRYEIKAKTDISYLQFGSNKEHV